MNEAHPSPLTVATGPARPGRGFMNPSNIQEAIQIAEVLAKSNLVPDEYKNNPNDIIVAIELGHEVGLSPIQSLQNISVIGKRPQIWGDALKALVLNCGLCVDFEEWWDEAQQTAFCRVQRVNYKPAIESYSITDAQQSGLIGGQRNSFAWKTNPKRMCKMRARSFAVRDHFPDVLKGLCNASLADDHQVKDIRQEKAGKEPTVSESQTRTEDKKETIIDAEIVEETGDSQTTDEDETVQLAVDMLTREIPKANTREALEALKEEIVTLPEDPAKPLVELWNEQASIVKAKTKAPAKAKG